MTVAAVPARTRARIPVMHPLLVATGFAGLGYQIVWTRMLTVGLGHEIFAVLAVVGAFFIGLAAGAALLDRPIARSVRPGLWYGALEALIGVWSLALVPLLPLANGWMADAMGQDPSEIRRWAIAFGGTALLLAPATVAMGATLPAAERVFAARAGDERGIGGLYAANTLGAALGAVLTAVLLVPAIGFSATLIVFATVNLVCAGIAFAAFAGPVDRGAARGQGHVAPPGLLPALFVSGLAGIGLEILVMRALAQVFENTIYAFASVLAVYLIFTALGAAVYQRAFAARRGPGWDVARLAPLLGAAALGVGVAMLALLNARAVADALALGSGVLARISGEVAATALVFGPVSAAKGAVFAHLVQGARGRSGGLGGALALNTFGGALAPLAFGVLAVPGLGVLPALTALGTLYLIAALVAAVGARGVFRWIGLGLATGALACLVLPHLRPAPPRLVPLAGGVTERMRADGVAATVTVLEDAGAARFLVVNGSYVMGGTTSAVLDRRQTHLALLRHPDPRRALFLGVGTGVTLAAVASHPELRATGVELLPEVIDALPEFPAVLDDLRAASHRIAVVAGDARRFVRAGDSAYDVIVADTFHPARDGAALLYTREHFSAIRARLAPGGIFAQWLPLHQLDLDTLRRIVRTYRSVFPGARLGLGNANLATPLLVLYGTEDDGPPARARLAARRLASETLAELDAVGLDSPFAVFGGFLAGPEALADFAGDGPPDTDDHPLTMFEAPRLVYAPTDTPQERLLALLDAFPRRGGEALALDGGPDGAVFATRLEAYWRARDRFIRAGASQTLTGNASADLRALAPELLNAVQESPDFTPAYRPLIALARAVVETEPQLVYRLVRILTEIAPERPEAARIRTALEQRYPGIERTPR